MERDTEIDYKKKYLELKNKLKKKNKDNFVEKNLSLFKDILSREGEILGHSDLAQRYFYTHKRGGKEIPATRLNLFIEDILLAKVMLNVAVQPKDYGVRYSMGVDALIRHLKKGRVNRTHSTKKKD